jgi:hypothetical protein
MNYSELIQLYFERSNALQSYWTLYVVIIGGLLAFSSLNKRPSFLTTALVTILFCIFAYKNLDAIRDTTSQRLAVLQLLKYSPSAPSEARAVLEPTLNPASDSSVRTTHISSDILTVAALWTMELRRRKYAKTENPKQA